MEAVPDKDKLVVSIRASVVTDEAGDVEGVELDVSDNGPGIADESKGKIFDMFYTEAKTGDSRRGLGLGLALCKSIVTAHGGEISVSDAEPHGAVFTFSLPEVKTDEQGTDTGR